MIHASPTVRERVTETFNRRVKRNNRDVFVTCVRLKKGVARTLAANRYVQLPSPDECEEQRDDCRKLTSQAVRNGAAKPNAKLDTWRAFALDLAGLDKEKSPRILLARQRSRLLVNMAGGVFENGGLSLDRLSGLPVIPGSAIKGCARHMALAALHKWTSDQLQPGDPDNLLSPAIGGILSPVDFLYEIALVFGWGDWEWKGLEDFRDQDEWDKKRSDFAWSCGEIWTSIRAAVATKLLDHLRITPKDADRPWESLPNFAGAIAFLPALPWDMDPGIDLDVVTCHHGEYYKGSPAYAVALDTEEPVPVIFPAIAPGQIWAFLLQPMSRREDHLLLHARRWLSAGIEVFGIGAKSAAGYGFFDASEAITREVLAKQAVAARRAEEEAAQAAEEARKRLEEDQRRLARETDAAATADMTPEQKADWKLAQLTPAQFAAKLRNFHKEAKKGGPAEEERAALVRALRGPKLGVWNNFKAKASKGELATAAGAIHTLNKQLHGDKMP